MTIDKFQHAVAVWVIAWVGMSIVAVTLGLFLRFTRRAAKYVAMTPGYDFNDDHGYRWDYDTAPDDAYFDVGERLWSCGERWGDWWVDFGTAEPEPDHTDPGPVLWCGDEPDDWSADFRAGFDHAQWVAEEW